MAEKYVLVDAKNLETVKEKNPCSDKYHLINSRGKRRK